VTDFSSPTGAQTKGQVRIVDLGAHVNVGIDTDGDNAADMIIQVLDVGILTQADFVL